MDFLYVKAFYGLLAFDLRGLGRDFARLHEFVRSFKAGSHPPGQDVVERVCRAVNHACVWYPRAVLCLQRSTVTTCLLRSCGVRAQMVVGAQILPFKAHAWTEVEGKAINERKDVQKIYGVWERC
jgi:prolyl oligopeptidase